LAFFTALFSFLVADVFSFIAAGLSDFALVSFLATFGLAFLAATSVLRVDFDKEADVSFFEAI
jgi:hypothetical protein